MLLMTRAHHSSSFRSTSSIVFAHISSGENSDAEEESEDVTKQLAVRNIDQELNFDGWGFDRKSDFLTTSHVIRLFGAGTQVLADKNSFPTSNSFPSPTPELFMSLGHLICFMLVMLHFLRKLASNLRICIRSFTLLDMEII